ncbi:DegT/DnrJ/EryC1/StrS family aminotransferase [Roseibium salinum]|nr:DegT/DnrJ/EryC1/StrS family aminotransferase [Roseibium salinum]
MRVHGSRIRGQANGDIWLNGDFFSSFFSHHISTMEGGMVVTDDEELWHVLLALRAHGWTRNLPKVNRVTTEKSDDAFAESFRFILPGYNVRPLEMSGALGLAQIRKLPTIVSERRQNADRFLQLIRKYPYLRVQKEIGESSWFGFSLIVEPDAGVRREQLVAAFGDAQIDTRPIVAGNFTKNEVLKWFDYSIHGNLANAEVVDQAGLFHRQSPLPPRAGIRTLGLGVGTNSNYVMQSPSK